MASRESIARNLLKGVNRAVRDFDLVTAGDRIAVGVSGGKDSRTLLDLLVRGLNIPPGKTEHLSNANKSNGRPRPYEIVAIHVDGSEVGLPDLCPVLEPWFRALGVAYDIVPLKISEDESLPMDCFRCSWNRRKSLFFAADRHGCNKVALGHHADDAAVTTLMSLLQKGQLESLEPRRNFFEGHFIVIRPLIMLAAAEIARYARTSGWVLSPDQECPRVSDGRRISRRVKVERFLASFSDKEQQQIRKNLWRITHPEEGAF